MENKIVMAGKYVPPHLRDKLLPEKRPIIKEEVIPVPEEIVIVPEPITSGSKDQWARERNLFRKIAEIKKEDTKKERDKDYNNWIEHYDETLRNMYNECVHPELMISFERFVFLAYVCSRAEQNTHKQTRPLI